jgi:amidase
MNSTMRKLATQGWRIIDPVNIPLAQEIVDMDGNEHLDVLTNSFKQDLEDYLGTLVHVPSGVQTLEEVINFNDQHSVRL